MVANSGARLRRTQRGQQEIRHKSHVLTQSERLILVLSDGYTTIDALRLKLQGVADRHFKLGIADLLAKGFVEKAVTPNRQPEALDTLLIEPYVRQDPLDPISIAELTLQAKSKKVMVVNMESSKKVVAIDSQHKPAQRNKLDVELEQGESGVDFYLPLEAPRELQNMKPSAPVFQMPVATELIMGNSADLDESSDRQLKRARRSRHVQIGYGLLFVGLVCAIVVIVLLKSR